MLVIQLFVLVMFSSFVWVGGGGKKEESCPKFCTDAIHTHTYLTVRRGQSLKRSFVSVNKYVRWDGQHGHNFVVGCTGLGCLVG